VRYWPLLRARSSAFPVRQEPWLRSALGQPGLCCCCCCCSSSSSSVSTAAATGAAPTMAALFARRGRRRRRRRRRHSDNLGRPPPPAPRAETNNSGPHSTGCPKSRPPSSKPRALSSELQTPNSGVRAEGGKWGQGANKCQFGPQIWPLPRPGRRPEWPSRRRPNQMGERDATTQVCAWPPLPPHSAGAVSIRLGAGYLVASLIACLLHYKGGELGRLEGAAS